MLKAVRTLVAVGRGRWWRPAVVAVLVYASAVLVVNGALLAGVVAARIFGDDPTVSGRAFPDIAHLRPVTDKLWFGAQPTKDQYRELVEMGITVVVELTTGTLRDPRDDDPAFLRELGMEYRWLPLTDGWAPDRDAVARFVDIVEDAPGRVFAHSGAGVGRDMALTAAYVAATGGDVSLFDQLAIGIPTLEQAWFVAAADPSQPIPDFGPIEAFSRYVTDAPRTALSWLRARL